MRNRITTIDALSQLIEVTSEEEAGIDYVAEQESLPMSITPYFAMLMDPVDADCPLRKQVVCRIEESRESVFDLQDPCGEDSHSPVPNLVHRYPDRVLLIATDRCLSYCRYCTRRRLVGSGEVGLPNEKLDRICDYLEATPQVRDVLISGGDPLLLPDSKIEVILSRLSKIKSIELLRIGTRCPVFLPQRITPELIEMLRKYQPFMMSVHVNHPSELAPSVRDALNRIADAGIPMGSQTVLLKGINDSAEIMTELCHELLKVRVRPYYIYQCDPVTGTEHFRTSIDVGVKILEKMRGYTSGYALPSYVIDAPGGGGKIPVSPNYVVSKIRGKTILRNYENKIFEHHDPVEDTGRRLGRRRKPFIAAQLYLPNMGFDEPKQSRKFARKIKEMIS